MEINEQLLKQFNLEVNSNYTYHSERMDSDDDGWSDYKVVFNLPILFKNQQ